MIDRNLQTAWSAVFVAVLVWSGIAPHDYPTWMLEVAPAVVAAAVLWFTRERFPLTRLTYVLILIHCIILMVGGHYTYAEVPLGDWIRDAFDQSRNDYDKLGHFAQGFVPAAWRSARRTNCLSGGWHCCLTRQLTHFSVPRAMYGIRSPICGLHCSAPWLR